ncbi:hypothetical protein GCM10022631_10910 [Deinococcus rubellus]|uniref:helix-turn-helix domain-containing protein n=1 Tax=Deinococcus rubellus TaxID=1889240 RepID=UPI0031E4F904
MYRLRPEHIRALRKQARLSLPALAEASRIGRATLCRWESHALTAFDFNLIHRLARTHAVNVSELIEEVPQ